LRSVVQLEEALTLPSPELVSDLLNVNGDILIVGAGGKMGPSLARLAKRAAPDKRIIAASRFSRPAVRAEVESCGVEAVACDLFDRQTLGELPRVPNVIYLVGHKFGSANDPAATWATNAMLPWMVVEALRPARIVALSTACVYPYADVTGTGADESATLAPPAGDYTYSCVAREHVLRHACERFEVAGRLVRLSYAIDMRYGVLHDVAQAVFHGRPIDVAMGYVNVIWQGDANSQVLRLLNVTSQPVSPINVTGPERLSIRWLADQFGERFGRPPILTGEEAPDAWLIDTTEAQRLFGLPQIPANQLIEWTANWVKQGLPSLGKETHFQTRDGAY
jgi:nucleoside-diphosphate-sugar epimerase